MPAPPNPSPLPSPQRTGFRVRACADVRRSHTRKLVFLWQHDQLLSTLDQLPKLESPCMN